MENPVLEPGADRIGRYKAERRREPAEELPNKWVRREENEGRDPESRAHGGTVGSDAHTGNGRKGGVTNGEVEPPTPALRSGR